MCQHPSAGWFHRHDPKIKHPRPNEEGWQRCSRFTLTGKNGGTGEEIENEVEFAARQVGRCLLLILPALQMMPQDGYHSGNNTTSNLRLPQNSQRMG